MLTFERITVGGLDIRIGRTPGDPGTVPLLTFNGLGARLEIMREFADALRARGIGTLAFDVPGIGESDAPRRPYRLAWLAEFATSVLDRLDIAGPVDVMGVSWGGTLAQEFARRYPQRVRRLVLAVTTPGAVSVPGRWSALSKILGRQRPRSAAEARRFGAELLGGAFRNDDTLFARYAPYLRSGGVGFAYQMLALAGWTSVHWLRQIAAPTLVLAGTDDPIMPVGNARILASLIPNARLHLVDDGHLFLVTNADETAAVVAEFLRAPARGASKAS